MVSKRLQISYHRVMPENFQLCEEVFWGARRVQLVT